ncbi:hypothetical protein BOX15_Mlig008332g1 [Macrostomum lignano]|uniref:Uncharacterized protein n=1 Tax=Macrostomum lignano TaxID=282301 RepID=A0A267EKJ3_9PLAT|nr:hypothetical protein BOX15_Mlig008332g1 [Macrostomum lignano]
MPLNVKTFASIGILLSACIAVTNSLECYVYDAEKDETPKTLNCNEELKKILKVTKLSDDKKIKHCKRMHGYQDGKYFAGGVCGDCSMEMPVATKSLSVTCSACTSDKCNSASRKGSLSAASAISFAACLLWLLNCTTF